MHFFSAKATLPHLGGALYLRAFGNSCRITGAQFIATNESKRRPERTRPGIPRNTPEQSLQNSLQTAAKIRGKSEESMGSKSAGLGRRRLRKIRRFQRRSSAARASRSVLGRFQGDRRRDRRRALGPLSMADQPDQTHVQVYVPRFFLTCSDDACTFRFGGRSTSSTNVIRANAGGSRPRPPRGPLRHGGRHRT